MSLYHETAAILSASATEGGGLKSKIFTKRDLKSPAAQVYALALESCKWSSVLKEVIENSQLLQHERKVCGARETSFFDATGTPTHVTYLATCTLPFALNISSYR
jgi:hypothetical protein